MLYSRSYCTLLRMKQAYIFVHGIDGNGGEFRPLIQSLRSRSFMEEVVSFQDNRSPLYVAPDLTPNCGRAGIEYLALQLHRHIEAIPGEYTIHLIGFSMGGIVSRYLYHELPSHKRIKQLITISSPHNGTVLAYLRGNKAGQQLRPRNPFLLNLQSKIRQLEEISCTSIWTPLDLMIVPSHSSQLSVGRNITIPSPSHYHILRDQRLHETIYSCLRT